MDRIIDLQRKVQGKKHDIDVGGWERLLEGIQDGLESVSHVNARTADEAGNLIRRYIDKRARVIAGGTDVLRLLKQKYLPALPEMLVDIKTITGLSYIKEDGGLLKIGALTGISDIESNELINRRYRILAEAAGVLASPQVRNMATVAGSILQDIHCWYYRADKDYFHCFRKGGDFCPAKEGDNRWMYSIYGAADECECYAACQSDMAVALTALHASVRTTKRTIPLEKLYTPVYPGNILDADEVVTEVQVAVPAQGTRTKYSKFSIRKSIDRPLVSVACAAGDTYTRIVVGGVYTKPYIDAGIEELLDGRILSADLAGKAGEVITRHAMPMSRNEWKVSVTGAMVKRALLELIDASRQRDRSP
jgi:xanthine dehydrogenase YagS FAD-binding subunit